MLVERVQVYIVPDLMAQVELQDLFLPSSLRIRRLAIML